MLIPIVGFVVLEIIMRKFAVVAAVFAIALSGTAHAEGARIELHGGVDNFRALGSDRTDAVIGVGVGYDFSIGEKAFIGLEANIDESTSKFFKRDLNPNVRIGVKLNDATRLYALAGYTNQRIRVAGVGSANADGVRGGVGLERNFGERAYGKIEYRYSNYEAGLSRNQGLVGFGIRF
jgi:outer membrane immunogenic protein